MQCENWLWFKPSQLLFKDSVLDMKRKKQILLRNTLHARHVIKFSHDMKPNTIYNVSYLISKGGNQNSILVYC